MGSGGAGEGELSLNTLIARRIQMSLFRIRGSGQRLRFSTVSGVKI